MKHNVVVNGKDVEIKNISDDSQKISFEMNGKSFSFFKKELSKSPSVIGDGESTIFANGEIYSISKKSLKKSKRGSDDHHMISPMPGKIIKIMVKVGDPVKKGTPLLILEAMKMEHTIKASSDGIIEKICYEVGSIVTGGVELVFLGAINAS